MLFNLPKHKIFSLSCGALFGVIMNAVGIFLSPAEAQYNDITLQSLTTQSYVGNGSSTTATLDSSGRYVVFQSLALLGSANLGGITDNNNANDIFLRDTQLGVTTCMSVSQDGTLGNKESSNAVISGDASTVAFQSLATNLNALTDTNNAYDIFTKNISTGVVTRLSQSAGAVAGNGASTNPAISSTGQYVAFQSAANNLTGTGLIDSIIDIFLYNSSTASLLQVTRLTSGISANGNSTSPTISGDGRYVGFVSAATNLVVGYTSTNPDIYVYDQIADTMTRESVNTFSTPSNGASYSPSLSSDGRYLAFATDANNLTVTPDSNKRTDIIFRDRTLGSNTLVTIVSGIQANGNSVNPVISGDGSTITFLSDATNLVDDDNNNTAGDGVYDVFIYTVATRSIQRVDLTSSKNEKTGTAIRSSLDSTGKICAFDYTGALTAIQTSAAQIYYLDLNCTEDRDGDGVTNCAEQCPDDRTKTLAGTCGCNVAETDSDGDGTPDCVDLCPTDPLKTATGACGCGAADTDVNQNGVSDCVEVKSSTVPPYPIIVKNLNNIQIIIPTFYAGVSNVIRITQNGRVVAKKTTERTRIRFNVLNRGKYYVTYRLKFAGVTSQPSEKVSFTIKRSIRG